MKRAEDVVSVKEKPYNSILPYLRSKQAEKAEAVKQPASSKTDKKEETDEEE